MADRDPHARYGETAWYEEVLDWHNEANARAFAAALVDVQPFDTLPSGVRYRDRRSATNAAPRREG